MTLVEDILVHAQALGFDRGGIIPIGRPAHAAAFADWLAAGYAGEMAYLANRAAERLDPASWLTGMTSLIVVAANYFSGPPPSTWYDPAHGRFARYAWAADYHDLLKARLFALDAFIRARTGRTGLGKACVDTAPLLERDFAAQAGLGFIGRNTCLIAPGMGSWTFLAALAVPEDLARDHAVELGTAPLAPQPWGEGNGPPAPQPWGEGGAPQNWGVGGASQASRSRGEGGAPQNWGVGGASRQGGGCGRCTRCLDACPTRAFVGPHVLDARRCIAYLTIELRGPIPRDLRPLMGNWVFGCDVCQEVCPYNRRATPAPRERWPADPGRATMPLRELLMLDEEAFRRRFRGTAIWRARRRGLVRNACVAAGNAGDRTLVPALVGLLADAEPLIRGHAAWALGQIGEREGMQALIERLAVEPEAWVREEIAAAL